MNSKNAAKAHRTPRWTPLSALALPALLALALDPGAASAGSPSKKSASKKSSSPPASSERKLSVRKAVNQIDGLTVEELDDGTTILRLRGNVEPTFNVYRLSDPERLVVDVSKSERGKAVPHAPVDSWVVGRVTISSVEEHDSKLARVVVNLKREASYIVVPKGRDLIITVTPKEIAPEAYFARKSAGERKAEIVSMQAEAEAAVNSAEGRAKQAEAKASSAEGRAKQAEGRADAAELRAKEAAGAAEDAQTEAERVRAEAERIKAEAEAQATKLEEAAKAKAAALERDARKRAKTIESKAADTLSEARKAAEARAEALAAAEARAVKAEREAAAAERRAARAKATAEAAEAKAIEIRDEAQAVAEAEASKIRRNAEVEALAEAEKIRVAAEAEAAKAKAEAEAKLATAEEAELAAKARLASASKRSAAAKASEVEAKAQATKAKAAKAELLAATAAKKAAEAELLAATRQEAAQKRAAQQATEALAAQQAKAEQAQKLAAKTEAAKARKKSAKASKSKAPKQVGPRPADVLLAEAERAMSFAESEAEHAEAARLSAEAALDEARKVARKAGKRDPKHDEYATAVTQAERAVEAASAREKQTKAELTTLSQEVATLEQAVSGEREQGQIFAAAVNERQAELAELRRALSDAEARYEDLGGQDGPRRGLDRGKHRRAGRDLDRARERYAALEQELEGERDALTERREALGKAQARLDETLVAHKQRRSLTRQWEEQRKAAGDAALRDVRFVDGPQGAVVIVEIDGPVVYDASSLTPNMNMLELRDTQIPVNLERSLDTTSFGGPVDRITSFREGSDVKIIVASQTSSPAEIELDSKGNRLIWRFPGKKSPAAREAVIASREQNPRAVAAAPAPDQAAADIDDIDEIERSEVVSLGGTKVSGFSTPPVLAARPGTKVNGRSRWRGERIDIELQDAPIKDVLLLFSDIGRVNIIAGPEVQGSVTMKLSAVPWDQALDIILRSLNLGMVQEGNVIRVATLTALEEERRKAIEEANAQVQLKPLETRLIPLSYADVGDMLPKVQSVLSSRGSVTPDTRTNTLIVMDVAENIALAESLVRQLDSQTPQVLIEARIVEARTNWLRQLGIQWGFDFTASPGTGNPTGLLFPNSIGVGGGSGSNQSPTNGLILPGSAANPNYAVDLPAPVSTGTGGAIGFSFGSLSGNLNTNLRLSAAEDEGEVRIISAPKIVTLDNTEADIQQGVQIPISQVSAQGVNTRYVNATLGLRVTPQVTNEGAVLLDVQVQKNEADFVNTGARGDPTILTNSAQSQLLITDGDTAVIGGIYTRNQAINHSKVPWFAEIPIIGWFFKNKTERDDRSEMLIFLTPRIINRSTSIGG